MAYYPWKFSIIWSGHPKACDLLKDVEITLLLGANLIAKCSNPLIKPTFWELPTVINLNRYKIELYPPPTFCHKYSIISSHKIPQFFANLIFTHHLKKKAFFINNLPLNCLKREKIR